MLLAGRQKGHLARKKTEGWGAGMVICLERCEVLHMAQLMPLPLTISCFSKIQIGFTFLVPAHPGSIGQRDIKRVCVCVRACVCGSGNYKYGHMVTRKTAAIAGFFSGKPGLTSFSLSLPPLPV